MWYWGLLPSAFPIMIFCQLSQDQNLRSQVDRSGKLDVSGISTQTVFYSSCHSAELINTLAVILSHCNRISHMIIEVIGRLIRVIRV